jgi:drug/metabolite transporter (DMT)-like permease
VVAVGIWGASFTVTDIGLHNISVSVYLFLRFMIAFLTLMLYLVATKTLSLAAWRDPTCWFLGVILYVSMLLQSIGIRSTTPSRSAFLTALSVMLVPTLSTIYNHRRLSAKLWMAVALSLLGIFSMFGGSATQFARGDVFSVLCALGFALYVLLAENTMRRQDPINAVAVQCLTVIVLGCVPAIIAGPFWATLSHPTWSVVTAVVFGGVLATAVAYGCQMFAQVRISAVSTALILSLEPVFAAGISAVFGYDRSTLALAFGAVLLCCGAALGQVPVERE